MTTGFLNAQRQIELGATQSTLRSKSNVSDIVHVVIILRILPYTAFCV